MFDLIFRNKWLARTFMRKSHKLASQACKEIPPVVDSDMNLYASGLSPCYETVGC